MEKINKKFVIALGGSLFFPKNIDIRFFKKFISFIKKRIKKGHKFIFIIGGGDIARKYQKDFEKIKKVSNKDKDWIGIYVTHLNARLFQKIFRDKASPILLDKRLKIKKFGKYSVIIGAGWQPGWSTDFVAVQTAIDFKIKKVIILGKPDYVYTSDPDKNKNAKPIEKLSWKKYLKMIPRRWSPGLRLPVDPVAARLAKRKKIKVIVANGKDLMNFEKILDGCKFKGTTLS